MEQASSETALAITETVPGTDIGDLTAVALTPEAMAPAQAALIAWCDRKVQAVRTELADLEANLDLATEHGWKHKSVENTLNRTKKRITYYENIKAALAAGYLIVPNFPVDILAVRVQRHKQPSKTDSYAGSRKFNATPERLPAGEGRYVDERLFTKSMRYQETGHDGKPVNRTSYTSTDYDEVDLPMTLIKPTVLRATQRAMALRIFDQVCLVSNTSGRDPIIVGQLLDPRGNGRRCTFFVAWWLDTKDL